MKIKTLELQNFRRFEQASIEFPDNNLAVFIGSNGKGKSSILDALGILLAPLSTHFLYISKSEGSTAIYEAILRKIDTNKNKQKSVVRASVEFGKVIYQWETSMEFTNLSPRINMGNLWDYIQQKREEIKIHNHISLPLLAYYRVNRTVDKYADFTHLIAEEEYEYPQQEAYLYNFSANDFDKFITWYRNEEDKENELMRKERNFSLINPKLEAVRQSFERFFATLEENTYQNLRAERNENTSTLIISKNGEDFSLAQLSDGEKMLLAMVGDIARRLAIANPALGEKAYEGEGIVLIDEIELHLHPRWQRLVLPALQATFPNVQFIVTTHSPQVLSEVKAESIFILEENGIFHPSTNPLGRDSNSILEQVMGTSKRPKDVQDDIEKYLKLIQNNQLTEANALKESLLTRLDAKDAVFTQADAIIFKKQLLNS